MWGGERRGCMVARPLPVCSKLVFMSVFLREVDVSCVDISESSWDAVVQVL